MDISGQMRVNLWAKSKIIITISIINPMEDNANYSAMNKCFNLVAIFIFYSYGISVVNASDFPIFQCFCGVTMEITVKILRKKNTILQSFP